MEAFEEADHIDKDPTNDSPENLQLLTHIENSQKHVKESGKTARLIKFVCETCGAVFHKPKRGKVHRFCSRKCIGLFGFNKKWKARVAQR